MKRTIPLRRSHMRVKGPEAKRRAAKKRKTDLLMRVAKSNAFIRDGGYCRRCRMAWPYVHLEAAHITDAGMGGDPKLLRGGKASDYVTLCADCHRGPRSVHSGHVVIECGPERGDGPVTFVEKKVA